MKNKLTALAAVLAVSVFILCGCGASLQGLGTSFQLDLENSTLNCKVGAGLSGIETSKGDSSGTGDIQFDVSLDWKNKSIRCKVDSDSSDSGKSHLDFFLNWKTKDTFCVLDSEYPSTEEEKAAGAPDISSMHFDFLLNWQNRNMGSNLNIGPFDLHIPLSEESGKEGGNKK